MTDIKEDVVLKEVRDVSNFNKKGEEVSQRFVKFVNDDKNLMLNLKGELGEEFSSADRGMEATLTLSFTVRQKKIDDFKEVVKKELKQKNIDVEE